MSSELYRDAYGSAMFAKLAKISIEFFTEFLDSIHSADKVTRKQKSLPELKRHAKSLMTEQGADLSKRFTELNQFFFANMTQMQHPHYIGHQTAAAVPLATLFNSIGTITNQSSALSELSPGSSAIERAVIDSLLEQIGWSPETADGFGTNGGTLANITAILTAVNTMYPDFWQKGYAAFGNRKPVIVGGADAHYCIERACGMLGLGLDAFVKIPLDAERRMDVDALERFLQTAQVEGQPVACVVATSGSTPFGAFDDLNAIGAICKKYSVWLHIDGAHGASFLLSAKRRKLLAGVEQADSVTWDAHKMLLMPSLATFLLFKNRAQSFKTFKPNAPYLFMSNQLAGDILTYDGAHRTLECTRQSMALGIWGIWSLFGTKFFAAMIDQCCDRTLFFYEQLKAAADFEPLHKPEGNILCFRYQPATISKNPERLAHFQEQIRQKLLDDGKFYITGTKIDGSYVLRVTIINPLTEDKHILSLMEHIRSTAAPILN